MAGTLAFPSFVTGPKDDLATADVYNLTKATPINKIEPFEVMTDVKVQEVSALQGGKALLGKVKDGLNIANAAKALLTKGGDPLQRLMSAQGGLMNLAKALPPNLSGLASGLSGYVKGISSVTGQINGLANKFKNGTDLAKITALGGMINQVSCDKNVFGMTDRGAAIGAYAGVINMSMMAGIPGAYGAALKCEADHGILNQVTAACLPSAIKMSDLTSLADMANKVKPGVIKGLNPSVLNDFSSVFSAPAGQTVAGMQDTFGTVKDTFSKIEPDWMTSFRNGQQTTDLSCVVGSSSDFQRMMTTSVLSNPNATEDDQTMLAATALQPTDVHAEIASQFPMLADVQSVPMQAVTPPAVGVFTPVTNLDAQQMKSDTNAILSGGINPLTGATIDGVTSGVAPSGAVVTTYTSSGGTTTTGGGSTTTFAAPDTGAGSSDYGGKIKDVVTKVLPSGTIKVTTYYNNGDMSVQYTAPDGSPTSGPSDVTLPPGWSDADEIQYQEINARYNGKLKALSYSKSFYFNEVLEGRMTSAERDLCLRAPY